jgi:hypothetical protein
MLSDTRLAEVEARFRRLVGDADRQPPAAVLVPTADMADLLAEAKRLTTELAFYALLVHDRLQDGAPHDCARCREEGRRAGLREAARVVEGHAGMAALRRLAGENP